MVSRFFDRCGWAGSDKPALALVLAGVKFYLIGCVIGVKFSSMKRKEISL